LYSTGDVMQRHSYSQYLGKEYENCFRNSLTDSVDSVRSCYAEGSMVTTSLFCNHKLL